MVIGSSLKAPHHNEKLVFEEAALFSAVKLLKKLADRTLTSYLTESLEGISSI
ncbi:hypothetical protein MOE37_16315 [Bacillus atrophaeus]|uniref:hypothetical protein n=1 Tax=Bacillus atrophaeus TaxID=1452 RepID=UPI00227DCCE2|nr:hypothetical protein [Bacillus atrophaeus]MCY8973122.1 hypothetical protein [Bacillus atrophaeus]